jgi:hypothetical protein
MPSNSQGHAASPPALALMLPEIAVSRFAWDVRPIANSPPPLRQFVEEGVEAAACLDEWHGRGGVGALVHERVAVFADLMNLVPDVVGHGPWSSPWGHRRRGLRPPISPGGAGSYRSLFPAWVVAAMGPP